MLVDLMVSGLSGADTVRSRRTRPALKVLFITGYADRSGFEGELDNDVALKNPFELETLVAAGPMALHPERCRGRAHKPARAFPRCNVRSLYRSSHDSSLEGTGFELSVPER